MRLKKAVANLIEWERVCRVATADEAGTPHLVPVCQVVAGGKIYFASGNDGRKVLNLAENPQIGRASCRERVEIWAVAAQLEQTQALVSEELTLRLTSIALRRHARLVLLGAPPTY